MSKELRMLTKSEKSYLRRIGLSKNSIRLYELLLQNDNLSAQQAAAQNGNFTTANYRLFYELERRQLVRRIDDRPRRFVALPLDTGLQASLSDEQHQLKQLINPDSSSGQASIVVGRQQIYKNYMRHARTADKQISMFTIGIAYSDDMLTTQADAIKRGVQIRQVVQESKISNYYVLNRWLGMGIKLRLLKRQRGYHLVVIDDSYATVTFSNPTDTDERISIVTSDRATIDILQAQFEVIWQSARVLHSQS